MAAVYQVVSPVTTNSHDDPIRIFSPASGLPLVSHQRFPADGLFGDRRTDGHATAADDLFDRREAGDPGTLTDCPCCVTED